MKWSNHKTLSAVMVLLVVSGLGYSLHLGENLTFLDEHQYLTLTRNLVTIGEFTMDGFDKASVRTPGYPLAIYPTLLIWDSIHAARTLNFVLLAVAVCLLYRTTETVNPQAARIATLGVFGYPVLLYTAATLYPQTLVLFLFAATTWLLFRCPETSFTAVILGFALGWMVLASPLYLFVVPLALVAAKWLVPMAWRWRSVAIAGVIFLLLTGGWSVRESLIVGKPVFLAESIFVQLAISWRFGGARDNTATTDTKPVTGATDVIVRTVSGLAHNPKRYLQRFVNYFDYMNRLKTKGETTTWRSVVMFITYYTLLGLVITRLLLFRLHPLSSLEKWIVLIYLAGGLFHSLFTTRVRYRLPLDFMLISMAAISLQILWSRIRLQGSPR